MAEPTHVYGWGNNAARARMKGRPCRITARSLPGAPRSVRVDFTDGGEPACAITSVRALRRITDA